jgi:hypothetical protein
MTHKSPGRFRSKNQGLQGLFLHLNAKDIRKYIINQEYGSMSTLITKRGNVCFSSEYTNVPNTLSVTLHRPWCSIARHGTTATTVTKTCTIPLPSHT